MASFPSDPLHILGPLRPSTGGYGADLAAALADVRAAVEGGQNVDSILGVVHRELSAGRAIARALAARELIELERTGPLAPRIEPVATTHPMVAVRTFPSAELDPLAPAWTRGIKAAASRGPFLNELGERFWIDTFLFPHLVTIAVQTPVPGPPRLLVRLPISGSLSAAPRLLLGPGSVWLSSRELVTGRPVDEFVGLQISGGTIELQGISSVTADAITLAHPWRIALHLQTAPPANASPAPGPGADAGSAKVTPPGEVTIMLEASRPPAVQFASADATAYGSEISVSRTEDPPFYDSTSRSVVTPGAASVPRFTFADVRANVWTIGEQAPIVRAGWALAATATTAASLGEALGAGAVWLELGATLQADWSGLPQPAVVRKTVLSLAPAMLSTWITVNPAEVTERLLLWDEEGGPPVKRSSIDVTSAEGSVVVHISQPGIDGVLFSGTAAAHLDRPVAADGLRVRAHMPATWLIIVDAAAGTTAGVIGADPRALSAPHLAFALENALIKARPPAWFAAAGELVNGNSVPNGLVLLRCPLRAMLPTLPDPYAANFEFDRRRDVDVGWVTAAVVWPVPERPTVSFTIQEGSQPETLPSHPDVAGVPVAVRTFETPGRVLLDVSSNADQFGVALPAREAEPPAVLGMSLVAPARNVAVLTLPPISWEPMLTKAPKPADGDVPLPPPPHDGGAALLTADSVQLVPVEPIPLLSTYHDAIQQRRHFAARLPLPFGLIAQLQSWREPNAGPTATFLDKGGSVFLNRPLFPTDLEGGRQLAFRGLPPVAIPDSRDPVMPGFVELRNENNYARGVLSTNLHTRFEGDFFKNPNGIPLRQYDWSGYGASIFSDWRDPEAVGPAIIEVRFDVLVGRTAHEVVQMQSVIHPWYIRVVRTITMDRTAGGWILREDTGWVATSDGRFAYQADPKGLPPVQKAFPSDRLHAGPVEALVAVRNIRLDGPQFPLSRQGSSDPPTIWQPVRFDADVLFVDETNPRLVVTAGGAGRRVASRNITGWIHIDGPMYDAQANDGQIVKRVRPASAAQVFDLLATKGPAAAPIDAGLALGGKANDPGLAVRTSAVTASCTDDANTPHLVAAVRGSPLLPRDGAWSLARIASGEPAPSALDPAFPVPLVRPNLLVAGHNRWHLADPRDILQLADAATPATRYGLVQSLGTQKVFFPRPRVGNDPDPITLPKPPQLADVGALLSASGVFPGLAQSFDFGALKSLAVTGGNVGFSDTFTIGASGTTKEALLADLGEIQVVIEYRDEHENPPQPTVASITVNPVASPRWSLTLNRVCFGVRYKKKPLIRIFATAKADEHTAPTIANLNVRYEGILGTLQTIFTNVQQAARFLPGGKDAGIRVGFSQGHLTVRNSFALPNLPLGAGQITDVAVQMGFEVALAPFDVRFIAGLGSSEKPFRWIVSPLAGTGVVQVGINPKGLDILVQAGIGLGLAIDLGIASGAASITLAFELNTGPDPFEIRVILSGRASVDVLKGLASATITLACGLGIIPDPQMLNPPFLPPSVPPPSPIGPFTVGLTGSVSVGIHISVCWVIDVDWDGYWQFRQDIKTPAIPIPI